ncbi:MAG: response regulator [Campylobacterota bacterium]|nr:response regulator [Campylobacterota bacterium]
MYLNNFSLLHVEDDPDVKDIVEYILKPKVKNIYFASNGEDALEIYDKYNPDIILSDINMPLMNGLDMSKKIKEQNPNIPIVLFTSFDNAEYLKEAINIGIDKYIKKPFDNKMVCNTLDCVAENLYQNIEKQKMEKIIQSQSKLAAMGEMIGNIAHQWRQPLSVITTYVSGLAMKVDFDQKITNEDIRDCSKSVITQANLLSQTIDDFRDFFIEDDSLKREFNLRKTIERVVNLIQDSYKSNFINIVIDIDDDYIIKQNESQLLQAFLNIFNNAKDAFKINNIKDERYFFINIKQNDQNIIIEFKDNAGGISQDIIDRVFEPYFTTKFKHHGTGIGLYMTHKIITDSYMGKITAYNEEYRYNAKLYKGAVFKIVL